MSKLILLNNVNFLLIIKILYYLIKNDEYHISTLKSDNSFSEQFFFLHIPISEIKISNALFRTYRYYTYLDQMIFDFNGLNTSIYIVLEYFASVSKS